MASGTSGASRATPPKRMGRRISPLLTVELARKIAAKVAKGVPQTAAAGSVGVPRRTFQNWLYAGRLEGAEEPYAMLAEEIDLALDRYHASRVVHLHNVGRDDPRVTMWDSSTASGTIGETQNDPAGTSIFISISPPSETR